MPSNDPRKKKKSVSTAADFKKKTKHIELELPSGNVCLVKRPGLPQLLQQGVLPDILTPIADQAIKAGQSGITPTEEELNKKFQETVQNPEDLASLMESFDRVTAHCVIEPVCLFHRRIVPAGQADQIQESYVPKWEDIPEEDRDPDVLYTDDVDELDKMFIFNYVVGGVANLAEFRNGLDKSLASMAPESIS